jgi:hypothetical protein
MKFEVELLLSSIANGVELHTFRLKYWRAIHSEVMTHRDFSRNASSSRAIPVEKMLKQIRENPAGPSHWGKNEKGMQASAENEANVLIPTELIHSFTEFCKLKYQFTGRFEEPILDCPREIAWQFSAWLAATMSKVFSDAGYHKQVVNRITEPYQYINVILSSTEWDNFFKLRCHSDAMPEFKDLAEEMRRQIHYSKPQELEMGEWHSPLIYPDEETLDTEFKLKLSSARCASVSYKTVEGYDMDLDRANAIFYKLVGSEPLHASPTEHQAMFGDNVSNQVKSWQSNFRRPWIQYRKFIENRIV